MTVPSPLPAAVLARNDFQSNFFDLNQIQGSSGHARLF
jgi:hypothetical protein